MLAARLLDRTAWSEPDGDGLTGRSADGANVVVLGLPRGGVPVAHEVAKAIGAPLDVLLVRKVGTPGQPELAMAAVGEDGVLVTNRDVAALRMVPADRFDAAVRRERDVLADRAARYRAVRAPVPVSGRIVIIVDDGVATGATARAACAVARAKGAAMVVLAAPVVAESTAAGFVDVVDGLVTVERPAAFSAVGQFYDDFRPITDAEVVGILRELPGGG